METLAPSILAADLLCLGNEIKKIENLTINCYIQTKEEREEIDYEKVLEFEDVVPLSGVHQVDIEIF